MGSSPLVSTTQKKTAVERFFSYHEKNGFARRRGERIGFHMKKKWLAAAAAVLCAATMASCGQGVVDLTSSGQESASSAPVSSALSEEEVEDTLEGLEQYMASLGYISGTPSTMRGDMIGAKEEGHRYATAAATVEFYEYDLSNLNDTAKAVRESVEADGTFTRPTAPARKPPPRRKRRSPRSVPSRPNNAEPGPTRRACRSMRDRQARFFIFLRCGRPVFHRFHRVFHNWPVSTLAQRNCGKANTTARERIA